jgi:RNA polymerase sigma factor (sigma-70 family)
MDLTDSTPLSGTDISAVYSAECDGLYKFLYNLCGDSDMAEDLLQETFIKFIDKMNEGSVYPQNLRSFLYTGAYYEFLSHNRTAKKRSEREKRSADHGGSEFQDSFSGSARLIYLIENLLNEPATLKLTPAQKMIMEYRLFSPLSNAEIIECTGFKKTNYYRDLETCYRLIKSALEKDGWRAEDFL